ncbi:hypothetical protein XU18_1860 [Perkinsela sp. CCAP 1560/4]|nr:hypothetical protein XU18_1860 [Perkinsela sp. CCAP 1560/4]|eukprot:KNH07328.1 hypothetical protein XU18_1860 [Perkinsela sp. CCAP 1560/4]
MGLKLFGNQLSAEGRCSKHDLFLLMNDFPSGWRQGTGKKHLRRVACMITSLLSWECATNKFGECIELVEFRDIGLVMKSFPMKMPRYLRAPQVCKMKHTISFVEFER